MKRYLVTGGCGFIGSHLVDSLLKSGHKVRVLDDLSTGNLENVSDECDVVLGDIVNSKLVHECMEGMDGCYHLAAVASVQQSNENWFRTHQVNQTGTINVLDASRKNKTPVIYASSAAVYGDNAEIPLKENSRLRPLTAYGADKLGSEHQALVASLVHGVPTTGLRFFNVFGPRQNPDSPYSGVISIFVDRILREEPIVIYGDGEQTRDFIFVEDVIRALRNSMTNIGRNSSIFNVCTGTSISINQLAKTIMSITGISVPLSYKTSRKGDIRISVGDTTYAKQKLSITNNQSLVYGLRELIETYNHDLLVS